MGWEGSVAPVTRHTYNLFIYYKNHTLSTINTTKKNIIKTTEKNTEKKFLKVKKHMNNY